MSKKCINVDDKLKKDLRAIGINTNGINEADINAILTKISTDSNMSIDKILIQKRADIISGINALRLKTLQEKEIIRNLKENATKLMGFPTAYDEKWNSNTPVNNPKTLYIFTTNYQAEQELRGLEDIDGIMKPDTIYTNVNRTSAIIRTNSNGEINDNAIGFYTKKNQQDNNGKFIMEEGFFTIEDREIFNKLNNAVADRILDKLKSGDIDKVSITSEMGTEEAALPIELANDLAEILNKKLGLQAQVVETKINKKTYYGIKLITNKRNNNTKENKDNNTKESKENKETKEDKNRKEAIESLNAKRPAVEESTSNTDSRSILSIVFPNIEERQAKIDYIVNKFSDYLDYYVNTKRKFYQDLDIESIENDDEYNDAYNTLMGLTQGTEDEQRLYALANMQQNGKSLAEWIFDTIKSDMQAVVTMVSNNQIEELINIMTNSDSQLGQVFMNKARELGWEGNKLHQKAELQARYMASVFSKMLNNKVFIALQKAAASDLEFNENIKLTFDLNTVEETSEDLDKIDEEGKADDRSGLNLVKYKLVDPSKSLSIRMKRLLNKLSKTIHHKDGSLTHVFNDLGYEQKLNPQLAYYILLNEFSDMNDVNDFYRILDRTVERYPWVGDIKDKLNENDDLRNEFYRAMRTFMPAAMITNTGNINKLNDTANISAFMDNVQKNYEGHVVNGSHSLYNDDGQINMNNVNRMTRLMNKQKEKNKDKLKQYHPIYYAKHILLSPNKHTVEENIEALHILRGDEIDDKINEDGILKEALKDYGVDTTNIDLDSILPYIDDEILSDTMDEQNFDSELEAFNYLFTKDMRKNLRLVLNGMYNITSPNNGVKEGQHLTSYFSSSYSMIARGLTSVMDGITLASYSFNGKQRFSYTPMNYIDKMVNTINDTEDSESIERGTTYLNNNFLKFDFLKDNIWANELKDNISLRTNFKQYNILGIGNAKRGEDNTIQNVNDMQMYRGLVEAFFSPNDDSDDNHYGLYRNPLFSDSDILVMIQAKRYTGANYKEEIIANIAKVIKQELDRIIAYRNNKDKGSIIENYNDKRGNAGKFMHFPQLNKYIDEIINNYSKVALNEKARQAYLESLVTDENYINIEGQVTDFIEKFYLKDKSSIFNKVKKLQSKKEVNNDVNSDVTLEDVQKEAEKAPVEVEKKTQAQQIEEYNELLREFFYNDYFGQIQLIQLFGGDLAYYKNFRDFIKRNKQAYATGERIWDLNEDGSKMMNRAIYVEDTNMVATSYESMSKLLNSSSLLTDVEKGLIKGRLAPFMDIKATDGESLRSLPSFRKILKAMGGKWTEAMEKSYNNIINQRMTYEDFNNFWQIIKPFVYTHESLKVNDRNEKIPTQYKNSEYMITAIYSVLNTALNKSNYLKALNKFMLDNDIDVVHFHSSVKVGFNNAFDITYKDKESKSKVKQAKKDLENGKISQDKYNDIFNNAQPQSIEEYSSLLQEQKSKMGKSLWVHETPFSDYMIVQPNDDHLTDKEAIFSSQLRNIVPADLGKTFKLLVNNKQLNHDEAIKWYNILISDNLLDSFKKINNRFSSIESLSDYLQSMAANNPKYGDDVKKAFELVNGHFRIPLNSPTLTNKIEELILSSFKNAIQRQKIKGGNAVLASNIGVSDDLKIKYKNDDPTQGVEYFEVYLPYHFRDLFEDFHTVNDNGITTLDINKLKGKVDPTLLEGIALRIPTENKYSAMPIKIKGFLPVQAGSAMMFPIEYIAMSGTDFDVDKCFLMFKEYRKEVVNKEIGLKFRQWLKNKKEDLNGKDWKYFNNNYDGYTSEEIENIYDNVLSFADYYDEIGYNELYDTPLYKELKPTYINNEDGSLNLEETSKLSNVRSLSMRMKLRNNMLIDTIKGVLTSPEGSALSTQAGNYDNIKHGSVIQNILNDKNAIKSFIKTDKYNSEKGLWASLNALSTEELEEIYSKYSTIEDPNSITTYMSNHRNLMDGNALIGAFAINSSSHYKFQFLDLSINEDAVFAIQPLGFSKPINITKVDTVRSQINPNVLISAICSEYQAASPDNGKDPRLGALGVNLSNVYIVDFLSRIGLDPQSTGVLLRSNLLEDLGATLNAEKIKSTGSGYSYKTFSGNIGQIVDLNTKLRLDLSLSESDMQFAGECYAWISHIMELAKALNDSKAISKNDSPNSALPVSIAEIIQQRMSAEDFMLLAKQKTYPIQGFANFIDINASYPTDESQVDGFRENLLKAPVARQQAFYSLGITSARNLVQNFLPTMSDSTVDAVRLLRNRLQSPLTKTSDVAILKKFIGELNSYLLSGIHLFGDNQLENRNYYIHDFPMKFDAFLNKKDKKGNYVYQDIRDLNYIKRIINKSREGIYMKDITSKTSPQTRKHLNEALDYMYFNDNKEIHDIAVDLIKYAYYNSGMNFGHSNIGNFISTAILENLNGFTSELNIMNGNWTDVDYEHLERFVTQFMLNHPSLIPSFNTSSWSRNGDNLIAPKSRLLRSNIYMTGKYLDYIADKRGNVYQKIPNEINGVEQEHIEYKPIKINKTSLTGNARDYIPYYSWDRDDIFNDDLKPRGVVYNLDKYKLNKNKDKSDKNKEDKATKEDEKVANSIKEDNVNVDIDKLPVDSEIGDIINQIIKDESFTDIIEDAPIEVPNIEDDTPTEEQIEQANQWAALNKDDLNIPTDESLNIPLDEIKDNDDSLPKDDKTPLSKLDDTKDDILCIPVD